MRIDGGGLLPKWFYRNRRLPVTRRFAHLCDGPTGGDIPVLCRSSCPDCGAFCWSTKLHSEQEQAGDSTREVAAKKWNSISLIKLSRPFELERAKEKWTENLKEISAGRFRTGGNRICVPLLAGEHRLGVIILADRVSGIRYTGEEMDLLKCIGDQVGVSLLNLRLTKKIMLGKELEAFQTMSAFFIHDLKNTASTLSLMLQNLPIHFDDPAFRKDALRSIGATVDRINDLISSLSAFRQ